MSPAELAHRIAALDWSATSLQHQLAMSCAVEALRGADAPTATAGPPSVPPGTPDPLTAAELAIGAAYRLDGKAVEVSNVVALPVRPRTCWTTLHQLDGRAWATSSHFGAGGAWAWIVETVATEWSVEEDAVHCTESDSEGIYDGDDLVTIDGLPVYRIRHLVR